ncbi:MAG TPA: hypothetical protein VNO70_18245 [Blastocatellia bacterium]|nr:hypothetical protein [Blastocatellia bacterium]
MRQVYSRLFSVSRKDLNTCVANVRAGFVGAMDNFGRVVEPGWSMLNLPVETGSGGDAGYEALAAKK